MNLQALLFADANASFETAEFVISGVPFDRTSSFRSGTRFAPNKIREESWNFEQYLFEHSVNLLDIEFCDAGNLEEFGNVAQMLEGVEAFIKKVVNSNKFPILMGGEHSITFPAVKCFDKVGVIIIDAHSDFRDSYLNDSYSHACVTRRISELVGIGNVVPIAVRSISAEEKTALESYGLNYIDAFEMKEIGIENALKKVLNIIKMEKIYLSIDIDGIDPAYAPGTANPEPFGLTPIEVKKAIDILADKLVGFDIVEICPPYDNGNTSSLAARLIREVIAVVWKMRHKKI